MFKINQYVFTKIKGCPCWPSKIISFKSPYYKVKYFNYNEQVSFVKEDQMTEVNDATIAKFSNKHVNKAILDMRTEIEMLSIPNVI